MIRSLDGTWHRPFNTLELAALRSLVDPEEPLDFDGLSDVDETVPNMGVLTSAPGRPGAGMEWRVAPVYSGVDCEFINLQVGGIERRNDPPICAYTEKRGE